jgi:hypothetical protein
MSDPLLGTTGWVFKNPTLGQTPIAKTLAAPTTSVETSTVAGGTISSSPGSAGRSTPGRLGAIATAYHPTYGEGEFIYLLGVASTAVGSVVTWNGNSSGTPTFQTALAAATANQGQPLAVAMSANVANQYGWYQLTGQAVVATNGTLAAGPGKVYLAGSGQVTSTAAAGAEVLNAINVTATGTPAAGQAVVSIDRPFAQGAIT